jgi:hypothetical protein
MQGDTGLPSSYHAVRAATLAGVLLLALRGCRTVVPLASPAQALQGPRPRTLLLTDADHAVIRMTDARLAGDTVVGLVKGRRAAMPLSRLTAVWEVRPSPDRTIALAMAVGGAAAIALIMTHPWNDDQGTSPQCVPDPGHPGYYLC